MMKLSVSLLCVTLVSLAAPWVASAEDDGKALIDQGVELRRQGRDSEALEKFSEAYERSQSPRALAQVALAEQALGLWVQAEKHLEDALSNMEDAWITTNRKVLEESLGVVRERVGTLDVRCTVDGALVRLNGRELGKAPFAEPVHVVAGSGVLEVSAVGYTQIARTVTIIPHELTRETFDLVPDPNQAVAVADPLPSISQQQPGAVARTSVGKGDGGLRLAGWITGGLGVVSVGFGVVEYLTRESHAKKWNDDVICLRENRTRLENCGPEADAAKSAETLMTVGLVTGGLLGVASAVLFAIAPSDEEVKLGQVPDAQHPRVSNLRCGSGPGVIGLSCVAQLW